MFRRGLRKFQIGLLFVAIGLLVLIPFVLGGVVSSPHITIGKLVASSGLFLDIAGIMQLEVSGAFEKLADKYGDDVRYPYGPPSHITRQLSHDLDPDTPIWSAIRNLLFYEHQAGIGLLIAGFFLQLGGVWIWF
jgi:hypothetical protein